MAHLFRSYGAWKIRSRRSYKHSAPTELKRVWLAGLLAVSLR